MWSCGLSHRCGKAGAFDRTILECGGPGSASIRDIANRYDIDMILILNRKIDLELIRPTPLELLFYK
jgi:nucleotide-binding universal stress UspA family protein